MRDPRLRLVDASQQPNGARRREGVESFACIYIWRFGGGGFGCICIDIEYPDFYLVRYFQ